MCVCEICMLYFLSVFPVCEFTNSASILSMSDLISEWLHVPCLAKAFDSNVLHDCSGLCLIKNVCFDVLLLLFLLLIVVVVFVLFWENE